MLKLLLCLFSFLTIAMTTIQTNADPLELVGTPVQVSENRGVMAVSIDDQPYVAAFAYDRYKTGARNSLLLINPTNGQVEQHWFPIQEASNGDLFHMLRADNGCIYTTIGNDFVEFNLKERTWSFEAPIDGMAMSFVQSPSGKIYFGTYPQSTLWEFDAVTRELRKVGQLDPVEKYPSFLATDSSDWVYAGVGTARNNLVAMNTRTGERNQLIAEAERKIGVGVVYPGQDRQVYARAYGATDAPFFLLKDGKATPTNPDGIAFATRQNIHFQHTLADFPGGGKIKSCSLPDKTLEWTDKAGQSHTVKFDYITSGAAISSMTLGNDGNLYGSSNHPMHLWKFDTTNGSFTDYTGIPAVGGGNFPNLLAWKDQIVGPTYSSGTAYRFDPAKPWTKALGPDANPQPLGKYAPIARPRVSLLLNDGNTAVFAGFPGYGHTGGGMVFYDLEKDSAITLDAQSLLQGHSTVALRQLPSGMLIGGTSTEAPGGGKRTAETSLVFIMDPESKKILSQTEIGADVFGLEILPNGHVAGITRDSEFFIYNPDTQEVLSRTDVKASGSVINAGQSLIRDESGRVFLVLSQSISQVMPDGKIRELLRLQDNATSGIAIHNNKLYFATGARLWKYALPQ
jgi:hypothetical protein